MECISLHIVKENRYFLTLLSSLQTMKNIFNSFVSGLIGTRQARYVLLYSRSIQDLATEN